VVSPGASGEVEGRVLLPDGRLVSGALSIRDGAIGRFTERSAPDRLVLPGFVDVHVHGGAGHDTMDGEEGVLGLARFHARHGTTSLCPTTVTSDEELLARALRGVAAIQKKAPKGVARVLGAHLEGPFISEKKLGAQPKRARIPDSGLLDRLREAGPIALVTLAPELEGALSLVERLVALGIRASLGHSDCDFATGVRAYERGALGATHLFNAMTGLHHREPGLAAAALGAEGAYLELILDGQHVHEALFRVALRAARGKLMLVTDAIRAAGLGDGEAELGGQRVFVRSGRATLEDGTLAGSVLTLDRAFANAVKAGIPVERAAPLLSQNPADYLGRIDIGRLAPGTRADIIIMDSTLEIERVLAGGDAVDLAS
jgi:N-acetylglucosamine-6-phosphate deacetylase